MTTQWSLRIKAINLVDFSSREGQRDIYIIWIFPDESTDDILTVDDRREIRICPKNWVLA